MATLHLGDLQITGLIDIPAFDIPLTTLLPDADPDAVSAVGWIGPETLSNGILHLKIRSWLLRVGGRVILLDACVGAHKTRLHRPDWHQRDGAQWTADLAAAGLTVEDVDVVMCTHLHADHVGWNTRLLDGRWVPTFPNARYICSRTEYRFWEQQSAAGLERHGAFVDSVLPVMEAGAMDLIDDGWDLAPGLTLGASPGHTPGHMCVHAAHGDGAIFAGDAIHTPVQLAFPGLSSAFCTDADAARSTRHALLDSLADTAKRLIPAHFSDPGWIHVDSAGPGYRPRA